LEIEMPRPLLHHADDYLIQHQLDIQDSADLKCPGIVEKEIHPEVVKALRNCLNLSLEMFALLLGVNLTAMLRYESLSVPPYPQGNISRKICLLSAWLADSKSAADIRELLSHEGGLATLSGLLQSESVTSYLELLKVHAKASEEAKEEVLGLTLSKGGEA
jgi:hypothetical protein